jgi:hypothetical protein
VTQKGESGERVAVEEEQRNRKSEVGMLRYEKECVVVSKDSPVASGHKEETREIQARPIHTSKVVSV